MDHDQVEKIFLQALPLTGDERESFLAEACGDDETIKGQVRSLIAAHEAVGRFMADDPTLDAADAYGPGSLIGRRIGEFRIRRVIGRGGMGIVYEATQESPKREVALKVMQPDKISPDTLRRFAHEADILARFQHPNIAQVYAAGSHRERDHDLPFFAMEYIPNARTLTEYARHKGLDINARLAMFRTICDAVHHAHQRGIIHRDLKPGNILVTSGGVPKVIDFGVARRAGAALTTLQTGLGQLIGTLQYMSPEQCEGDIDAIDMRSDVYSLGVLLYELLCEALPYNVRRAAVHEAARVIRDEEPTRPSSYNRLLRGDIEVVTLKALEKDRGRRYQTAADFAADIERYLRREPIHARPPSLARELGRAVRRRWRPIAAVLAVLITALSVYWLTRPDDRVPLTVTARDGATSAPISGATVVARRITYSTRELGEPSEIGRTPLEGLMLDPGGYRLIVTHEDGRSTETVIDLVDGDEDGDSVDVWLRNTEEVTKDMVRLSAIRARVGHENPIPHYGDRREDVPAFWIDDHEVTNAEFKAFVDATGSPEPDSWINGYTDDMADHAVIVQWAHARAYAAWAGKRLPSDIEWERAARGLDGRRNIWGDAEPATDFMIVARATTNLNGGIGPVIAASFEHVVPATSLPEGLRDRTPEGLLHMGGNVAEWTETVPFLSMGTDPPSPQFGVRIVKGYHWASATKNGFHLANFSLGVENSSLGTTGFRCVRSDLP